MVLINSNKDRCGVLLVNAGTPSEPNKRAVKKYLSKYMMDKRIAPMNRVVWRAVLRLGVLPKLSRELVGHYQKIWTPEGSPFAATHKKLQRALAATLEVEGLNVSVECVMNYSEPTIRKGIKVLKECGCARVVVLPLYPQHAFCTTESIRDAVERSMKMIRWKVPYAFISEYHDNATYVQAIAASVRHAGFNPESNDKLLFSFSSIPLADIEAGDVYELQAGASSLQIASELGIDRNRWTIGYQECVVPRREWLAPYTKNVLQRWAQAHSGRVFIVCPGFAVDCLETLHDVEIEYRSFYYDCVLDAGRKPAKNDFVFVPCLDRSRAHLRVLKDVLLEHIEREL